MIDTHAHVLAEYYDDLEQDIRNICKEVALVINSGFNDESSKEVVSIANQYNQFFATVGIHPNDTGDFKIIEDLAKNKKVVAIGETGLDYHWNPEMKEEQKALFRKHIELAIKLNKPIVVHSRDAVADTIQILKEYPDAKGVIHCFSGSLEVARQYIKMGYKLGIGGVITFPNAGLSEVIKEIPLHNIVVETDCPYLAPVPYRGKKNYPQYVKFIYEKLAEIHEKSIDEVEQVIAANVRQLFDI